MKRMHRHALSSPFVVKLIPNILPAFRNHVTTNCRIIRNCHQLKSRQLSSATSIESVQPQPVDPTKFSATPTSWDLCVGVCLERKPVITSEKNAMEKKYMSFLKQYEIELSKKSDHEVRIEKDAIAQDRVKSGEIEQGAIQTAQDFEDTSNAELNNFVLQNRITDADTKKDYKSLQRALDSHLVLLVHQKLGNDFKWIVPQDKVCAGETLHQAAERILKGLYPETRYQLWSNAPWGFYKYKYPKEVITENGRAGAKVFFYKAQILSNGPTTVSTPVRKTPVININDHMWLTHLELKPKLTQNYYKSLADILVE